MGGETGSSCALFYSDNRIGGEYDACMVWPEYVLHCWSWKFSFIGECADAFCVEPVVILRGGGYSKRMGDRTVKSFPIVTP